MKRKTSDLETRIWTYGCIEPDEETRSRLFKLLYAANRYYNELVQGENERRAKIRELGQPSEENKLLFEEANQALRKLVEEACAATGRSKSEKPGPRLVSSVKPGVVAAALSDPKWPEHWKKMLVINEQSNSRKQERRKNSNLPAGTYLLVERAFEAACRKKGDLRWKKWCLEGRIGVQLRHESIQDVLRGESSNLRIIQRGPGLPKPASERQDRQEVQMRIGPGQESVRLACVIHRPMPADATVANAWLMIKREGPKFIYKLQLVLQSQEFMSLQPDAEKPIVAVDLGWRRLRNGRIRAAYWVDSLGGHGSIDVPAETIQKLRHCQRLQAFRDRHHNRAKALASAWLKKNRGTLPKTVPDRQRESLHDSSLYVHAWKSPKRLATFADRIGRELGLREKMKEAWTAWRTHRDGLRIDLFSSYTTVRRWVEKNNVGIDPFLFYLECWRHKNKHLFIWVESQRQNANKSRDAIYRIEAARMEEEYGMVVFENFDLRAFARNALEDEDEAPDDKHLARNIASPGQLRLFILSKMGQPRVKDEEMADSTKECHLCGHVNTSWQKPEELVQTCAGCGATWDQDFNAASILLRRVRERLKNGGEPVAPRRPSRPKKRQPASVET